MVWINRAVEREEGPQQNRLGSLSGSYYDSSQHHMDHEALCVLLHLLVSCFLGSSLVE